MTDDMKILDTAPAPLTDDEREYQARALASLLREVKTVDSIDVGRFLEAHIGVRYPTPEGVCKKLGLSWPSVRLGLEASPELMGHWENFQWAAIDQVMAEIPEILADNSMGMPDRKAKASVLMQWAKMMNPKRFGDNKGGTVNIQFNVGELVMEARERVVKMKQRALEEVPVEDAGL